MSIGRLNGIDGRLDGMGTRLDGIERGLDTVLEILRAGGGPAR